MEKAIAGVNGLKDAANRTVTKKKLSGMVVTPLPRSKSVEEVYQDLQKEENVKIIAHANKKFVVWVTYNNEDSNIQYKANEKFVNVKLFNLSLSEVTRLSDLCSPAMSKPSGDLLKSKLAMVMSRGLEGDTDNMNKLIASTEKYITTENERLAKDRVVKLINEIRLEKSSAERKRNRAKVILETLSWASFVLSFLVAAIIGYTPLSTHVWPWVVPLLALMSAFSGASLKFGNFREKSALYTNQFTILEDIGRCAENELDTANTREKILKAFSDIRSRYHAFNTKQNKLQFSEMPKLSEEK